MQLGITDRVFPNCGTAGLLESAVFTTKLHTVNGIITCTNINSPQTSGSTHFRNKQVTILFSMDFFTF